MLELDQFFLEDTLLLSYILYRKNQPTYLYILSSLSRAKDDSSILFLIASLTKYISATIPITKPIICPPDEKIITLAFVSSQLLIENKYKKRNTPVSESKNTEVNLVVLYQKDILLYK